MSAVHSLSISQGLKAGLAAGVVYGLMVGLSHLTFQAACSQDQIAGIAKSIAQQNLNFTAQQIYSTQLVVLPIYWGLGTLVFGVLIGVVFSILYHFIPGKNSKRKSLLFSLPVFVVGFFLGLPGYGIACTPNILSFIPLLLSVPISLIFCRVLGVFYDSFGRLAVEQRNEAEKGR